MPANIPISDKNFPSRDLEEQFFGKWFPRIGALAVVLGAGFGFKYAIDQGWVGARLRVILGILLSSVLIGIGDWARKKDWTAYANAITGGGIGLMYLTLWAAVGMYGLLPPTAGFICLVGVSGLGCVLALRHESQTLALLAVIGGFVNPFVTGVGVEMPEGLYLYVLSIDLAVVVLGFMRPWNILEKVAFVASWVVLEIGGGSPGVSLLAATGIFLMFGGLPYATVLLRRRSDVSDLALIPVNGLLYLFAVFNFTTGELEHLRGPLTLALAIFFFAGFLVVREREEANGVVGSSSAALSFIFLTLWVPVQLGAELMALGWALESLMLLSLAIFHHDTSIRLGGWAVLVLSGATQFFLLAEDPGGALSENYGRFVLIILIAATSLGSYIEHRSGSADLRDMGVVGANLLTLFWLSFELYGAVSDGGTPRAEDLQFGLSGVWGMYAAALLGIGIAFRLRVARLMSLGLFGITVSKMALHDLWLLDTLQRLIGFVGIGLLLLACSLLYHRFRGWIVMDVASGRGTR